MYAGKAPKVIFEIDGAEYFQNKMRIQSDKQKTDLVKRKELKLIRIPNQYVKHYEFIRELTNKVRGGAYQKTLFDI
jgi:very-short-patch-repair endonuclease